MCGTRMPFPSDYPGAIVVEAAHYGFPKGARNNRPKAWCLHTPEEPADDHMSTPYYLQKTDRDASVHYFVSFHGFVCQLVPEAEGPYANGVEGKPYPVWADSGVNLNLQTLSIEIEGYAATIHQTMPRGSPQCNALVNLMAHRCKALNIPPGRTFGHYVVSVNRSDPGQLNIPLLITDVIAATEDDMTATEFAAMLKANPDFVAVLTKLNQVDRNANEAKGAINTHTGDTAKHEGSTGGVSEARVKEIVRELVAD